MKVLFINPPQTFWPDSPSPSAGLPLGIMYIAALLDKMGYKVEILDALVVNARVCKKGGTIQVGMPWAELREEMKRGKPDIIGISNPFSSQVENAIKVANIAKEACPDAPVIVGGPHVSVQSKEFLEQATDVDIVVAGEGEYTMLDIMEHYAGGKKLSQIEGIAYRENANTIVNPVRAPINNLDELPLPAYHLVNMDNYLKPKGFRYRAPKFKREISLITSRGCPFNCIFCSIHLHMGKRWRAHSKEYVVAHVQHLISHYNIEHIHFEDDNLTLNKERFERILDDIIAKRLKFSWDTPNGIRAEGLSLSLLSKMKRSGCADLTIGAESGDQYVLDNIIDKRLKVYDVEKMAQMCQQLGIKLAAFYVIGFPGEKRENMQRTIDFAFKLKRQYSTNMNLFIATPLYGTRLYELCRSKGYLTQELTPRALSEATQWYGRSLIATEDFASEEVDKLVSRAVRKYIRLSVLGYVKHPVTTVRLGLTYPRYALRALRSLFKI